MQATVKPSHTLTSRSAILAIRAELAEVLSVEEGVGRALKGLPAILADAVVGVLTAVLADDVGTLVGGCHGGCHQDDGCKDNLHREAWWESSRDNANGLVKVGPARGHDRVSKACRKRAKGR